MTAQFSESILKKSDQSSPIVVGIDPNFSLMPEFLRPNSNSGDAIKSALIQFSKIVIESTASDVCAIKPQAAYFEQFGTAGVEALAETLKLAKDHDLRVIMDVKRGDIGSTSSAYARGYLSSQVNLPDGTSFTSDLESDAMTINPFMGEDSVEPFIKIAQENNKGLFILVRTSNPGSALIMEKEISGQSVSHHLAARVQGWGSDDIGASGYHSVGAVVGATVTQTAREFRKLMPNVLILIPGMGAQGGQLETVLSLFNEDGKGALIPISRGMTYLSDTSGDEKSYREGIKKNCLSFISLIKEGLESRN